jgi:hypothetical protein
MECVPELFPSKGRIGESNGEFIGEKFTHSQFIQETVFCKNCKNLTMFPFVPV